MKRDIAERWITALRSGNYKQGIGMLRSFDDRYCCLGVLCDLYLTEQGKTWDKFEEPHPSYIIYNESDGLGIDGTLPSQVMKWSGIQTPCGKISDHEGTTDLTKENDFNKRTFEEIAIIIQNKVDKL